MHKILTTLLIEQSERMDCVPILFNITRSIDKFRAVDNISSLIAPSIQMAKLFLDDKKVDKDLAE